MIRSVAVSSQFGTTYFDKLDGTLTAPGVITEIQDMGPVDADVNVTQYATVDGGRVNSTRLGSRTLSLIISLVETDGSIEKSRHELYAVFAPKAEVMIDVTTDEGVFSIIGTVEKCVPNVFSSAASLTATIICPDPYWYSDFKGIREFGAYNGGFEFPFGNEQDIGKYYWPDPGNALNGVFISSGQTRSIVYEDQQGMRWTRGLLLGYEGIKNEFGFLRSPNSSSEGDDANSILVNGYVETVDTGGRFGYSQPSDSKRPLSDMTTYSYKSYNKNVETVKDLMFSEIKSVSSTVIKYTGSIDNGFTIRVSLYGTADKFPRIRITSISGSSMKTVEVDMTKVKRSIGSEFRSGDQIVITTKEGSRSVQVVHGRVTRSILNAVGENPQWPVLTLGINTILCEVPGGDPYSIGYTIEYDQRVMGI